MGLIYAEQVEYMSVDQMQQTHEDEIKILAICNTWLESFDLIP